MTRTAAIVALALLLSSFEISSVTLPWRQKQATVPQVSNPLLPVPVQAGAPIQSLAAGTWVKLICGASNHDVPSIRNLCFLYTLAGVDCIDMSPDPAVVIAAREGINAALTFHTSKDMNHMLDIRNLIPTGIDQINEPYVMISVNDDDDPHFRKAYFDVNKCPPDCSRPCEKVCPAMAIPQLDPSNSKNPEGVLADRCYGCGRCVPTCPYGMIDTASYKVDADAIKELFETKQVNAIEIHTQYGHETAFDSLVKSVGEEVFANAKVIAVSLPDMGNKTIPYMEKLQSSFTSHPMWHTFTRSNALADEHREGIDCAPAHGGVQIWQCDGRPMSGDIGRGTARAAVEFANDIIDQLEAIETIDDVYTRKRGGEGTIELFEGKQYVQLAGGTNDYSPVVAKEENLAGRKGFGGYAFGGFARKRISKILSQLDEESPGMRIEDHPDAMMECLEFASTLVNAVKCPMQPSSRRRKLPKLRSKNKVLDPDDK